GETAEEAYRRHIEIVTVAERFVRERKAGRAVFTPGPWAIPPDADPARRQRLKAERRRLAARLLPVVQEAVSAREPYVVHYEDSDDVLAFVDSREAPRL